VMFGLWMGCLVVGSGGFADRISRLEFRWCRAGEWEGQTKILSDGSWMGIGRFRYHRAPLVVTSNVICTETWLAWYHIWVTRYDTIKSLFATAGSFQNDLSR